MSKRLIWATAGGGLVLYFAGVGLLDGILAEPLRFAHQRTAVLNQYDEVVRKSRAYFVPPEHTVPPWRKPAGRPWAASLRRVEDALAQKNVSAAELAWHDAHGAALRSRRWEGMLDVGDAYLRLGEVAKGREAAEATARTLYLSALFRARQEESLDGVLRTAEAFAALGDREVVDQCIRIAELLAAQDPEGQADVRAFRERWAG